MLGRPEIFRHLKDLEPIHFLGVCGSGMAPLAELTAALGVIITGSDLSQHSRLDASKYAIQGSAAEDGALRLAKSVVFSSAISADNPSLLNARRLGKIILHRSDLLSIFSRSYKTISIAGTHGKTTTSALLAHILWSLNSSPSWIIGANFSDGRQAFHLGDSDILVIEADESDGSFTKYKNFISVVNNVEPDHLDYYLTIDNLHKAFSGFLESTSLEGAVVFNADDAVARKLALNSGRTQVGFGFSELATFRLAHIRAQGLSTTGQFSTDKKNIVFKIPLTGRHNALNAMAAIAVSSCLGHDPEACAKTLISFPGVSRRMQPYENKLGALVFDDYAHNPGKIQSCLHGLLSAFPDRRIIAVFQPHRYSRVSSLYTEFTSAFRSPRTKVIVLPIYSAGEAPIAGYEPESLALDIAKTSGVETFASHSLKDAADLVKSFMDPQIDLLVTIGAGDVWRVAQDVASRFNK